MKTGKITAKLRDAVSVCLIENGQERKRYKNIELPDAIKELEMKDFHFQVPVLPEGKITFEIEYEAGILPRVFPEPRARVRRAKKAAEAEKPEDKLEARPESPIDKTPEKPVTLDESAIAEKATTKAAVVDKSATKPATPKKTSTAQAKASK